MKAVYFFLACMMSMFTSSVAAHAIWIESSPVGVKGKVQTVRVYYGEYEHAQVEKTTNWYSDLSKLRLYLVHPDQSRTQLSLTVKDEWLEATFIPAAQGTYTIYTSHVANDLWEEKRFQFSSSACVQVGNKQNAVAALPSYSLSVTPKQYVANREQISVALSKQGTALADREITIMAPQGWVKKLKTDSRGNVSFVAGLPGTYVIEYGQNEEESGELGGKPYKETWQTVTTHVVVN